MEKEVVRKRRERITLLPDHAWLAPPGSVKTAFRL